MLTLIAPLARPPPAKHAAAERMLTWAKRELIAHANRPNPQHTLLKVLYRPLKRFPHQSNTQVLSTCAPCVGERLCKQTKSSTRQVFGSRPPPACFPHRPNTQVLCTCAPRVGERPVRHIAKAMHFHHHAQTFLLLVHQLLQAKNRRAGGDRRKV